MMMVVCGWWNHADNHWLDNRPGDQLERLSLDWEKVGAVGWGCYFQILFGVRFASRFRFCVRCRQRCILDTLTNCCPLRPRLLHALNHLPSIKHGSFQDLSLRRPNCVPVDAKMLQRQRMPESKGQRLDSFFPNPVSRQIQQRDRVVPDQSFCNTRCSLFRDPTLLHYQRLQPEVCPPAMHFILMRHVLPTASDSWDWSGAAFLTRSLPEHCFAKQPCALVAPLRADADERLDRTRLMLEHRQQLANPFQLHEVDPLKEQHLNIARFIFQ
eukprot:1210524-Rhodomonas_salina.2